MPAEESLRSEETRKRSESKKKCVGGDGRRGDGRLVSRGGGEARSLWLNGSSKDGKGVKGETVGKGRDAKGGFS